MQVQIFSFIAFVLSALPVLAAASALKRNDNECTTGTLQCCNSTQASSATALNLLSALLNIALPNIAGLIGIGCSPVTVVGAGANTCSAQPVCCTNNYVTGGISLGCNPINL